jgi:hypothetical protein
VFKLMSYSRFYWWASVVLVNRLLKVLAGFSFMNQLKSCALVLPQARSSGSLPTLT